ncbi:MAG: hypothetical protein ACI8TX_002704, partial [Hyphomicrobiaceae bacterium]
RGRLRLFLRSFDRAARLAAMPFRKPVGGGEGPEGAGREQRTQEHAKNEQAWRPS